MIDEDVPVQTASALLRIAGSDLDALADSFASVACAVRAPLLEQLRSGLDGASA